ncbi:unnamed protein product, partial [Brassica rapa]
KLKEALHSRKESAGTVKGLQKLSELLQAQLCHVQMKSLDVITLLTENNKLWSQRGGVPSHGTSN